MPKECDAEHIGEALDLDRLNSAYLDARAAWLASATPDVDLISDGDRFEVFEAASRAVIAQPCHTIDAVRRKVSFVHDAVDLYAMVKEDEEDGSDLLRVFLSSLIAKT